MRNRQCCVARLLRLGSPCRCACSRCLRFASERPLQGSVVVEARSFCEISVRVRGGSSRGPGPTDVLTLHAPAPFPPGRQVEDGHSDHAINWDFAVESRDIAFRWDYVPPAAAPEVELSEAELEAAAASDAPARQTVVGPQKVTGQSAGVHAPLQPGTYILHFDNTYSLLTRKSIRYDIKLAPATPKAAAAE